VFRILVVSLLLVACAGSPAATQTTAPTSGPTAAPTAVPTGAPTVAPTEGATPSAAASPTQPVVNTPPPGAQIVVPLDPTGAFLMTPDGYSLYTFDNDSPNSSSCADECAGNWPPFTVGTLAVGGGEGVTGTFGSITRDDGMQQVTYNEAPLYFFGGDASPGDTNGDGLNGVWHLATP
jgi:predicted lipoprotein with Yx(FWY)xxD motif